LEKEAIMYKLKRQEIQAQTRECKLFIIKWSKNQSIKLFIKFLFIKSKVRRALYKKNQEIRRKKREVKCLKAFERELLKFLDKCDNQPADIQQSITNNLQIAAAAPSAFRVGI
jgi:hypothetical protein